MTVQVSRRERCQGISETTRLYIVEGGPACSCAAKLAALFTCKLAIASPTTICQRQPPYLQRPLGRHSGVDLSNDEQRLRDWVWGGTSNHKCKKNLQKYFFKVKKRKKRDKNKQNVCKR